MSNIEIDQLKLRTEGLIFEIQKLKAENLALKIRIENVLRQFDRRSLGRLDRYVVNE